MSQYINLFNPTLQKSRDPLRAPVLGAVVAAATLAVIGTAIFLQQQTSELERQVIENEARLKQERDSLVTVAKVASERKPDAKLVEQLARAEVVLKDHGELITLVESGALGKTEGFSEQLRAFAHQSMNGLWLTGFTISTGQGEMEINGKTVNAELLPAYIRRLNSEPVFRGRSFATLHVNKMQDDPSATAEISKTSAKGQRLPSLMTFSLSSKLVNNETKVVRP